MLVDQSCSAIQKELATFSAPDDPIYAAANEKHRKAHTRLRLAKGAQTAQISIPEVIWGMSDGACGGSAESDHKIRRIRGIKENAMNLRRVSFAVVSEASVIGVN